MPEQPSAELLSQLEQLGLATAEEVASVRPRVRKLAGKLPWFDSLWVDGLRQARLVTPYQATELSSGRGEQLRVGPYVIQQPVPQCHYARVYEAREIATQRPVRLLVSPLGQHEPALLQRKLRGLMESATHLTSACLPPVTEAGIDERAQPYRLWVAAEVVEGTSAAEWMVGSGRFPPEAVLEIARQMIQGLAELERLELVHADLGAAGLVIDHEGVVRLPHAGVRAVLRPEEGYGAADLNPAAYDYLAPERVAEGTAPTIASDIYACGCLWWYLLTGRGPLGGGDSLARMQSAHRAKIVDVCRLAPETPPELAAAIRHCTQREPGRRPESFADLTRQLGTPTDAGRESLAACFQPSGRSSLLRGLAPRRDPNMQAVRPWMLATAGSLLVMAVVMWPLLRGSWRPPVASVPSTAEIETPIETETTSRRGAEDLSGPTNFGQGNVIGSEEPGSERRPRENVLLLPADRPLKIADLSLRPGLIVRGLNQSRPRVEVPVTGLVVDVDDVRFEDIDFVAVDRPGATRRNGALLVARCRRIEFRGCSFQAAPNAPRAAIVWADLEGGATELGARAQLLLVSDCLVRGTATALAMRSTDNRTVEMNNTLVLGPGPLLQIGRCPRLEEPLTVNLSQVTLRGAAALVEFRYETVHEEPGKVAIDAKNCVFAPAGGGALLFCRGLPSPARLLHRIEWTGEGSLLAEHSPVAVWQSDTASPMPVDDSELSIDGLSRSRFSFAGSESGRASDSVVTKWSAPLATKTPPGVNRRVVSGGREQ